MARTLLSFITRYQTSNRFGVGYTTRSKQGHFKLKQQYFFSFTEDKACPTPIRHNQTALTRQTTTITCPYPDGFKDGLKFMCKGQRVESCQRLSEQERFSLSSDNHVLNVTISEVNLQDEGSYWCGADIQDTDTHSYSTLMGNVQLGSKQQNFYPFTSDSFTHRSQETE